jgi:hypothetical protein
MEASVPIKDSIGSDEESSSNSSSCSSSSGISSLGQITAVTEPNQNILVVPSSSACYESADELERAVGESLEALVSSVVASQSNSICAPVVVVDALMIKEMPLDSVNRSDLNQNQPSSSDIISSARRHIFNALTQAQKLGQRESSWCAELHISSGSNSSSNWKRSMIR